MSQRFVCVHGHFYQPPRENPWTDRIDVEVSAAPWPNWNERVADECYEPNTVARVLDGGGRADTRANNFQRLSFNVGPTLLDWLKRARPATHDSIVAADAEGARQFGRRGGAMGQAFNHVIMPLANGRDRRTQVRWGAAHFRSRFGRVCEGMWLPETAVDLSTLETLAEEGIRFTVLAAHQAESVRSPDRDEWVDVGEALDTGRAYRQRLPSGRQIYLYFYDAGLARAVAFGGLLHDGDEFARRLAEAAMRGNAPRITVVATDGESYGHHHPSGEMALARALQQLERDDRICLTTLAEHLERHPPEWEVRIREDTSWSCEHDLGRWKGGCACGIEDDGDASWRTRLRIALDGLRDDLATMFERSASGILANPWEARDAYLEWLMEESGGARDALSAEARRLLEQQRHAMLMHTSCGWFFGDPGGLETRQVLRFAARALELSADLPGVAAAAARFRASLGPLAACLDVPPGVIPEVR